MNQISMTRSRMGGGRRGQFRTNSEYLAQRAPGRVASHAARLEQESAESAALARQAGRQSLAQLSERHYGIADETQPRGQVNSQSAAEPRLRAAISRYAGSPPAAPHGSRSETRRRGSLRSGHKQMARLADEYWRGRGITEHSSVVVALG